MGENIMAVTGSSFAVEVLKSDVPVLVDFWAEWCGPCRILAPVVKAIAEKYSGKLKVVKLNVDEHSEVATTYNIRGIPSLFLFKNGKIVATKVGMLTEEQLSEFLDANL